MAAFPVGCHLSCGCTPGVTLTAHLVQTSNGKVLPEGQWDDASCAGALHWHSLCSGLVPLPPGHAPVPIPCHFSCFSSPSGLSAGRHLGRAVLGRQGPKSSSCCAGPGSISCSQPCAEPPSPSAASGPCESCRDLSVHTTICSSMSWP